MNILMLVAVMERVKVTIGVYADVLGTDRVVQAREGHQYATDTMLGKTVFAMAMEIVSRRISVFATLTRNRNRIRNPTPSLGPAHPKFRVDTGAGTGVAKFPYAGNTMRVVITTLDVTKMSIVSTVKNIGWE